MRDEKAEIESTIVLRESWYDTLVSEGDHLHLIGSFDSSRTCVVDNARNMVILHPDFLVSCTVVADSFGCTRKAVMQDRVKATGDVSRPMVYGNILHALFQVALEANDFSTTYLNTGVDKLVIEHVESLYVLHEEIPVATEYLRSKLGLLQDWAKTFVSAKPKVQFSCSLVSTRNRTNLRRNLQWFRIIVVRITQLSPSTSCSTLKSMSGHPCSDSRVTLMRQSKPQS